MAELFVYGTLMVEEICLELLCRLPLANPAILEGFTRRAVRNERYPGITHATGHCVHGLLLKGSGRYEVDKLDRYEGGEYTRIAVTVMIGTEKQQCWTYLWTSEADRPEAADWDFRSFLNTSSRTATRALSHENLA